MAFLLDLTTRPRTDTTHDVFVRWGDDDPCHVGTITKLGRRDWQSSCMTSGGKREVAHDVARHAISQGRTPYVGPYDLVYR